MVLASTVTDQALAKPVPGVLERSRIVRPVWQAIKLTAPAIIRATATDAIPRHQQLVAVLQRAFGVVI